VGIVEPVTIAGVRVSSSQIRELIDAGRVDEARSLLGHYFFISGTVVAGQRRGRALGFPTANIESRTEVLPLDGIYATVFEVEGRQWLSASSIGLNPTFGAGPRTVESFIFDFDREIYDQTVKLYFVKRIRGEQKFDSVEALIGQMHRDVAVAKDVLRNGGWEPAVKRPG
jgi:riboflavin kinase/FMN adenylyltransferase